MDEGVKGATARPDRGQLSFVHEGRKAFLGHLAFLKSIVDQARIGDP